MWVCARSRVRCSLEKSYNVVDTAITDIMAAVVERLYSGFFQETACKILDYE